jgi:hypothetical protein
MSLHRFRIWRMPLILASMTLFGLAVALLGDERGREISWCALGAPLLTIAWQIHRSRWRSPPQS